MGGSGRTNRTISPLKETNKKPNGTTMDHNNDGPLMMDDSSNEGVAAEPPPPRAAPNPGVSHQAMLRQQAHAPVSINNDATGNNRLGPIALSLSHPNRYSNPQLEGLNNNINNNLSIEVDQQQQQQISIPEHIDNDGLNSPTGSSSASGWSVVETNGGIPPSARSLHAGAILNGVMYVFGGYDGVSRVNTFHAFSFAEKRWSPVLPSANSSTPPSPRDRHVAFAFGNSFYVHGGFDGTSRVSDFWGFDFSSMTWREVVVLAGRPPSPRHSHAAVVHRHSLYIFGGYDGSYK